MGKVKKAGLIIGAIWVVWIIIGVPTFLYLEAKHSIERDMLLWLPLTENFDDISPNALVGEVLGDLHIDADSGAAVFDGDEDYALFPTLPLDDKPFAISVWLKLEGPLSNYSIFQQKDRGARSEHLHVMLRLDLNPYFGFYMNDLRSPHSLSPEDGWRHLVFQFTGEEQQVWVDGELDISRRAGAFLGTSGPFEIGRSQSWTNVPAGMWHGKMRDLRVFDKTLTERQIRALTKLAPES